MNESMNYIKSLLYERMQNKKRNIEQTSGRYRYKTCKSNFEKKWTWNGLESWVELWQDMKKGEIIIFKDNSMNILVFWPEEDANRIWPGKTLIEYSHIVSTFLSFSKCDTPELLASIYSTNFKNAYSQTSSQISWIIISERRSIVCVLISPVYNSKVH